MTTPYISSRQRVQLALNHQEPDRVPVDFLATPAVWNQLTEYFEVETITLSRPDFFQPEREAVLRELGVDCRVLSYDMFCQPPEAVLKPEATVDWWGARSRATPARMWRQRTLRGEWYDIWGHHSRLMRGPDGAYEEFASWPLADAETVTDLQTFPWPQPDWWDFSPLPDLVRQMERGGEYHLRFRIGSVFETAWQLRGMQQFLLDFALDPAIPLYIMERVTEVMEENLRRVLELVGGRLDLVTFDDDLATQHSLMISYGMWQEYIRPYHARLIAAAKAFHQPVMYHCAGAMVPLIPDLIDLGVDVLSPVQPDAADMLLEQLKQEYGDRLAWHGGVDTLHTLQQGSTQNVADEVCERIALLGQNGGYILAGSHPLQPNTPLENILEMYRLDHRHRV